MGSERLSGIVLDGRYEVGELVGAGGFGAVYAAVHLHLGAKVAVKVPAVDDLEPGDVAEAIGRFVEEARMLKRIRHPNVAAALDVGLLPADGAGYRFPYLVLEWCSGPTLKDWRRTREGLLGPGEVWPILRPVFEAIAHVHQRGLAHRDIKPSNIVLERARDGSLHPLVIDFGIAKRLGSEREGSSGATRTTSARSVFTPTHAAPEQLLGLRTGPRTDVYALALLLLETIGGKRVFASEEEARLALVAEPPTPQRLGYDLGPWNEPIARALARRAGDRYEDAHAFLEALGDAPTGFAWVETSRRDGDLPARDDAPSGRDEGARSARKGRADSTPAPARSSPPRRQEPLTPTSRAAETRPPEVNDTAGPPSSRTLRTRSAAPTPSAWTAAAPAACALVVGLGTLLLFVGLLAHELPLRPARLDPSAVSAAPSRRLANPEAVPATSGEAARPLMSLQTYEIAERAEAVGMTRCRVAFEDHVFRELRCAAGTITLTVFWPAELDETAAYPRRLTQLQARARWRDGDVRHATGDGAGIVFVGYPPLVDRVAARVLEGVRHEGVVAVRGLSTPQVSPDLAAWRGDELAARLADLGALVAQERRQPGTTAVLFRIGDAYGSLALEERPAFPVSSMVRPFVYAEAGTRLLTLRGDAPVVSPALLSQVLAETRATSRGEYR